MFLDLFKALSFFTMILSLYHAAISAFFAPGSNWDERLSATLLRIAVPRKMHTRKMAQSIASEAKLVLHIPRKFVDCVDLVDGTDWKRILIRLIQLVF